jgi:sialic acid synthase SpsE
MVKRIVAARNLSAGAALTVEDLAFRIPASSKISADALQPCDVDGLVGKILTRDVEAEEIVTYQDVGARRQVA